MTERSEGTMDTGCGQALRAGPALIGQQCHGHGFTGRPTPGRGR